MKVIQRVALMVVAIALLAISIPVYASEMDDRIESSARKSYVFETYLQTDDIKIHSVNGVVALTGTVSEASHRLLARESVAACLGLRVLTTGWKSKVNHPLRTRMRGS